MPKARKKHQAPPPGVTIQYDEATKERYAYHGGCIYRLRPTKGWIKRRVDFPKPDAKKLSLLAMLFMKWGRLRGYGV